MSECNKEYLEKQCKECGFFNEKDKSCNQSEYDMFKCINYSMRCWGYDKLLKSCRSYWIEKKGLFGRKYYICPKCGKRSSKENEMCRKCFKSLLIPDVDEVKVEYFNDYIDYMSVKIGAERAIESLRR